MKSAVCQLHAGRIKDVIPEEIQNYECVGQSRTATAGSAKTLTGPVTVNNANKIATRLVYDTQGVESVRANRIEGAPMPRHQITPALR